MIMLLLPWKAPMAPWHPDRTGMGRAGGKKFDKGD